MNAKRLPYSKEFSDFYDIFADSDFPVVSERVKSLLEKYNPNGTTLLDVGCGTGKVLEGLPNRYSFTGIDISKHMLEIAKKKFPKAKFTVADMTSFNLKKKFDSVICMSDVINHLPTYSEWEKTFQNVSQHLKEGGLFIFDMNTPIRLKRLIKMDRFVSPPLGKKFFTVKVFHVKNAMYSFSLQIFTLSKNAISVHEENILESSFPLKEVRSSLKKHFSIEDMIDIVRQKVSSKTGKVIFVCRK